MLLLHLIALFKKMTKYIFTHIFTETFFLPFRSIGISQLAEVLRERSRLHETEKERRSPTPEAVPELPKEEIYKKTKAVLDKYLLTEDLSVKLLLLFCFLYKSEKELLWYPKEHGTWICTYEEQARV